jgi:hypothetical protein
MLSALTQAVGPPPNSGYTLKEVTHSFADLEALTMRLASAQASLNNSGIAIVSWGPDPASNTVLVGLSNYTASAADVLKSIYGAALLTVEASSGSLPTPAANRYYDTPYFYNGDRVWFDNNPTGTHCTEGFAFTGNRSGNTFNTTAGHCGGVDVYTNYTDKYFMGTVSTNYLHTTGGVYDIESFPCQCFWPTWYEGPSIGMNNGYARTLVGQCACGVGQYVTMDGASTGEATGNYVSRVDFCQKFNDGLTRCHLNYASNPNGHVICQGGDSGGPVYQRESDVTYVLATGLIVGYNTTSDCYYHDIADVLSEVNGTLIIS